ncbi:Glycosyl transferase family 2 [Desulfosarcina cetonica]|uniref:glycosyltransferase family 2 protein n=1 Tax=Desulfosarcina cetonica TaxID=90730 RepID=UPI0006CFE12B|nr:glycosyltransferase family 2 protein [Desulfosarcina cetonica]VTR70638.1 Glycosyl transferase family 2 [Desulfosarcina cetonica]
MNTDAHGRAVSVAIVAKDEAGRIGACLDSLGFADEVVVVVDDRSRDDTLAIAEAHGCRTLSMAWMGYGRQKQFAVDACTHDWVLILDADERVPPETGDRIRRLIDESAPPAAAYGFLRRNIFHGRWFKRCGWWPDRVLRLVDRRQGRFSDDMVHEQWICDGPVERLDAILEHYSFPTYADLIEKMQNYSTLAARQMEADGRQAAWWSPILHGLWMFFRSYVLELGVLEGFDGFVISLTNAGGSFMKYAKLRERRLCKLS